MNGGERRWTIRLTAAAEADFHEIVRWTSQQFGEVQAGAYAETLSAALTALLSGPTVADVRQRNDIVKGLFTLHVAREGRRGRYFLMFRIGHDQSRDVIDVLRFLHDAMDLQRHMPPTDEGR